MSTAELLKRLSVVIDLFERADRSAKGVLKSEIQMLCERLEQAHGLGNATRSKELLERVHASTIGLRDFASAQNAITLLQIGAKAQP